VEAIKLYTLSHLIGPLPSLCPARSVTGTAKVDRVLFQCKLLEQERDGLKSAVLRSENWPVGKDKLISKCNGNLNIFANNTIYLSINYIEELNKLYLE
jgi:hypothetical protein